MRRILILMTAFLLMISCSKKDDRSDAYGNFESTEITISAQGNGELLSFDINEGESLQEKQVVGQIDTTILMIKKKQVLDNMELMSSKIQSAELNLKAMKRQKELLQKEQNRVKDLFDKEATTEQNLDKITTELDVSNLKIKALMQDITSLKIQKQSLNNQLNEILENLSKTRIINPINGVVLTKYKEPKELVSAGILLYKIADLQKMYLKIFVSATQLDDIKIGQKVEVLIDRNEDDFHKLSGKITWISASSEFTPKNIQTKEERVDQVYAVKVLVKNDGKIKIGMPGEVNFY